jgi:archaemetzincin
MDFSHQKICIAPLGVINETVLTHITSAVEEAFGIPVVRLPAQAEPVYAFDEDRGQYYARSILRVLSRNLPPDALKVLAVTEVDLFIQDMNYVFGEAVVNGHVGVISLCRLRPEFYGKPKNERLLIERAIKEAIHELGHTFGLRHSADPSSVMHFSTDIHDTDRKSAHFATNEIALLASKLEARRYAA